MVLHIWMHWFWITSFIRRGLLLLVLRNLICSPSFVAEAGLLGTSFMLDSGVNGRVFNTKGNTSQNNVVDVKERWRRGVEDEGGSRTESTTSFLPPRENRTVSNADNGTSSNVDKGSDYPGITASDVGDTYNGGNLEGFQYPLKKYSKYNTYAKYKTKPKSTEDERDAANSAEEKLDADIKEVTSGNGNDTRIGDDREMLPHLNGTQTVLNSTTSGHNVKITEKPAVFAGGSSMSNGTELSNRTVPVDGMMNVTENGDGVDEEKKNLSDSAANVTEEEISSNGEPKEVNLNIENKVDDASDYTTIEPFLFNNRVAAATSSESHKRLSQPSLDAGSITGITLGIIVVTCSVGAISFLLYRRRYLNKPQALNDKCSNLDSSGYIDDTSLRENSEEMYSLDNDSFLNSLEAMTIQNYWTENVKHTKL